MFKLQQYRFKLLCTLIFALIYGLISLVNHYNFRTYALDLGLYTQALYAYGHFKLANSLMIQPFLEPLLGGHFDLYLIIFSPLVHLFGTITLLLIQIAAIVIGAWGVYVCFKQKYPNSPIIAKAALLYFFCFYGVFSAIAFYFHSVVVAS